MIQAFVCSKHVHGNHTCQMAGVWLCLWNKVFFLLSAQISGQIQDADGNVRYVIKGYWDQQYDIAKVISGEGKNVVTEPPVTLWRAKAAE